MDKILEKQKFKRMKNIREEKSIKKFRQSKKIKKAKLQLFFIIKIFIYIYNYI